MLDVSRNKNVDKLPKSLGYAQLLTDIKTEGLNLIYPPQDIVCGGVTVIVAFLAKECGIEYSPSSKPAEDQKQDSISEDRWTNYQNKDNDIQVLFQTIVDGSVS